MSRLRTRALGVTLLLMVTACSGGRAAAGSVPALQGSSAPKLHVLGNRLLDANNHDVVLHGVDRSGPEFACHPSSGVGGRVFDGPSDDASVAAIAAWRGVSAVRVPLNEDCWLALQGADPTVSGPVYQLEISQYVQKLHAHGLVAILDLHWTDGLDNGRTVLCSSATASCQKSMPDATHAPAFWASVAQAYKDDQATVFDVFNEPFVDMAHPTTMERSWICWLRGGSACSGMSFTVAGMQDLVDAVRKTGARNVVMVGGLSYSLDLTGWLKHKPYDPTGNLAASWHVYNFTACVTASCWNANVAPVAKVVPVIAGEIGENDCKHTFIDALMPWLDAHRLGYLGWTWNTYAACKGNPILITDYNGTPSAFGLGIKNHLSRLSHG